MNLQRIAKKDIQVLINYKNGVGHEQFCKLRSVTILNFHNANDSYLMLIRIIGILPLIAVVSMSLFSDRKKERNENKVTREGEKINRSTQLKNPKLKGLPYITY